MKNHIVYLQPYRVVTSYLTNRDVILNDSPGFLIPPTFEIANFRHALTTLSKLLEKGIDKRGRNNFMTSMIDELVKLQTKEEVARRIAKIVRQRQSFGVARGWEGARIRDLFVLLWGEGCLIFPQTTAKLFKLVFNGALPWNKQATDMISKLTSRQEKDKSGEARLRGFRLLLLSRGGVRSIGDLTPEACGDYFVNHMVRTGVRASTVSDLVTLQKVVHKSKVVHSILDYGPVARSAVRSDNTFMWVVNNDASLAKWTEVARQYMTEKHRNLSACRGAWNKFFDFLIQCPDITRNPLEYLHLEYSRPRTLELISNQNQEILRNIFEWMLDNICVYEDEYGRKAMLPGYGNPLSGNIAKRSRAAESPRDPMPHYLVQRLTEVLTENDYAWPRRYGIPRWNRKGGDYIQHFDLASKRYINVWSPVRAISIFVKLKLPPRTFQVRVLDSGEADREKFYGMGKGWRSNDDPLAKANKAGTRRGVFYKHIDQDGTIYTFLYFNTSKTGDIDKDSTEQGYVMQWQHREVLDALVYLRNWQTEYNPILAPTPWTAIKEVGISAAQSQEVLSLRGSNCFLFRDACSPFKEQPVTDMRINTFWLNLNAELEKRLRDAGEVGSDGKPIMLVTRNSKGVPCRARFDLHSLRVTHITAYAESGVPIHIIMKVVDHKSVVMALHYIKISPSHISETLNATSHSIAKREQEEWLEWLSGQARSTLITGAAFSHFDAIDVLSRSSAAGWVVRDHGICPVGCARCNEGGQLIVDTKAYKKYSGVPGGANNCVRCRFFITGPAFLLGLQAHFDKVGFQLRDSSQRYQISKDNYEQMESKFHMLRERGEPIPATKLRDLEHASGVYEQDTHAVDDKALSWHATYRLIGQCLAITKRGEQYADTESKGAFPLVATGGVQTVEAVIEESTEFELVDRVCQSAVFFSGIDAAVPNLRRMRAFDAMLNRQGLAPCFFEMDEQQALVAGNQLSKLLYAKVGRANSQQLMLGQTTLSRLGIAADFERFAMEAIGVPLISSKSTSNNLK
ncbi:gamma-mobile-trio integrase GmtZ [Caballeronia sp. DA-9]|uniref:gamma-mobile-trio integrase GmtZ n=1 Tax=Caballeronia sp. DA-9 TaxID=3436237 RepID=UPI003F6720AB